jgi:hypothetical protein
MVVSYQIGHYQQNEDRHPGRVRTRLHRGAIDESVSDRRHL